jgi:glutamate racemase
LTTGEARSHPIGVFDSGVGGLSVLRALQAELPYERFVYVGDQAHAPYGERDDSHILTRSHAIADHLIARHNIKALVVACNTATASAIQTLRAAYPALPIVGIEPALKPAAAQTRSGVVAVMATRGTLQSEKFKGLLNGLHDKVAFRLQACDGLADAIERADAPGIEALCQTYTGALGPFGSGENQADVLVLGCTHYPFVADVLGRHCGTEVPLIEAGLPVAKQTRRLLQDHALLANRSVEGSERKSHWDLYYSTGDVFVLESAALRWLRLDVNVQQIRIQ